MQEYNLQRDINASTERRFYTIEERMEKYEAKVDRIIYIQLATIILFIATFRVVEVIAVICAVIIVLLSGLAHRQFMD